MVRMQIQFTEAERRVSLRREAAQRHVSISAVVREAVDERLSYGHLTRPATIFSAARWRPWGASAPGQATCRPTDEYFTDSVLE